MTTNLMFVMTMPRDYADLAFASTVNSRGSGAEPIAQIQKRV
jgi:hypothetical protein